MPALIVALALAQAMPVVPAQPGLPDLSWLEGYWLSCGREQVSEHWQSRDGAMLGVGTTIGAGGKASGETMRIAPSPGGLSFFAEPSGQAPAEFPLASRGERRLVFENKAHDFPQRVLYWREGETLRARIEGEVKGQPKAMDWRYRPMPAGTTCPAAAD